MPHSPNKLKAIMNSYNETMQKVKDFHLVNTNVYAADKLNELIAEKRNEVKAKYLYEGQDLLKLFEAELFNSREELRSRRYPNLFGNDPNLKTAAEFQFAQARDLIASNDEEKILRDLNTALSLDRHDMVSYLMDSIQTDELKNKKPGFVMDLEAIQKKQFSKIGADSLVNEILDLDENYQIAQKFVKGVNAGNETIFYPYTSKELNGLSINEAKANMDRANQSLEMRSSIKPSLT